jgi:hypothetical protein
MKNDVFISFATEDKRIANTVCHLLEAGNIRVWIAERDILPGAKWSESIVEAISNSRIMVLILSNSSNRSEHVIREVELAVNKGLTIIPFRIEEVSLSKSMEYFISSHQWLDAFTPPLEKHIEKLVERIHMAPGTKQEISPGPIINEKKSRWKLIFSSVGILLAVVLMTLLFGREKKDAPVPVIHDNKNYAPVSDDPPERVNALAKALAAKYREGRYTVSRDRSDEWSSRPITLAIMDIKDPGSPGDLMRDKLAFSLPHELQSQKRVKVVTRELLVKLLEELNLSTSDLADPVTSLKIGRVLSANIIMSALIAPEGDGYKVSLMCIDTETSEMIKMISATSLKRDIDHDIINNLCSQITKWIEADFPLQGKVLGKAGDKYRINLGQIHGLKAGDRFEIIKEISDDTDTYNVTGEAEVSKAEKETSLASIISKNTGTISEGHKVRAKRDSN